MRLTNSTPPCLERLGITVVNDNLQPGQQLGGISREIVRLFGGELIKALQCQQQKTKQTAP